MTHHEGGDALRFRRVMGHLPTGVTVIATRHDGEPHGMTANAVTALSLDPLMLLVCLTKDSRTAEAVRRAGRFAVNVLAEDQEHLSLRFSRPGTDHFAGVTAHACPVGMPLLAGCVAHVSCSVAGTIHAGDHEIVLGAVQHFEALGGRPLVFFQGGYARLPVPARRPQTAAPQVPATLVQGAAR